VAVLQRLIQGKPLDVPEESGRGADGGKKGPPAYSAAPRSIG
jgi:hypothetical protein